MPRWPEGTDSAVSYNTNNASNVISDIYILRHALDGKKAPVGNARAVARRVPAARFLPPMEATKMDGNANHGMDAPGERITLFLVANGAVPATSSQELYELAWENGIKPLDEGTLKKARKMRRRKAARSLRRWN